MIDNPFVPNHSLRFPVLIGALRTAPGGGAVLRGPEQGPFRVPVLVPALACLGVFALSAFSQNPAYSLYATATMGSYLWA